MTKEELIEFLKDNLRITINVKTRDSVPVLQVELYLRENEELIDFDFVHIVTIEEAISLL